MKSILDAKRYRSIERRYLLFVSIILLCFFYRLHINFTPQFEEAERGYQSGSLINLRKPLDENSLRTILESGNYIRDSKELELTITNLTSKIDSLESIENLGFLNKSNFQVKASPTTIGLERYNNAKENLGIDSAYYKNATIDHKSILDIKKGDKTIAGKVLSENKNDKVGVLIRLEEYFSKSNDKELEGIDNIKEYYTETDKDGNFRFNGLDENGSYSVIPLKEGFEFGIKKGTTKTGKLLENLENLEFKSEVHKVNLFDSKTFKQLKEDKVFTVRTPAKFKSHFITYLLLFFLSFWGIHFFWSWKSYTGTPYILPLLMLLTGISVLIMFSIQDPLRDILQGEKTVIGVFCGLIFLVCLSQIQLKPILANYKIKILNISFSLIWGCFLLALVLMSLLWVFGKGPGVSNVKVVLWGVQPSEIVKYLTLVFLSGYLTKNSQYLRHIPSVKWRLLNNIFIIIGFASLLGLYIIKLGDMGPALVLCFTFLILYAGTRGELSTMLIGAGIYMFALYIFSNNIPENQAKPIYVVITIFYCIFLYIFGEIRKNQKDSAYLIVLLIVMFLFGEGIPHYGERLKLRNDIYRDIWNNQVFGGDQIAHGIWSLASGGWFGQGLGKGFSRVMPANHTDMIIPSIGEEIGWVGLLLIIICFGLLLFHSIAISRKAGQGYAFYLGSGISIVTTVQFFLIVCGSLGLIPLTGISVPFLSYGSSAMIANFAAFGIILNLSTISATKTQDDYLRERYDSIITLGKGFLLLGLVIITSVLFYYQIWAADQYIVKPVFVTNRIGQPIYIPNPRIDILVRKLDAGNIYDRNGLLLATSRKEDIIKNRESLENAGILPQQIDTLLKKRLKRYYPFEEHTLFWLGDLNEGFSFNKAGYDAEHRHLPTLRGFDNHPSIEESITSEKYRENAFLPPQKKAIPITKYDYSELIPILRTGINEENNLFKEFKAKNKDIKLSLDATLQTKLQNNIGQNEDFNKNRTSVVIINPQNGNVLASAVYPLPNYEILKQIAKIPSKEFNSIFNKKFNKQLISERDLGMTYPTAPGSTAKIITAFAGLNELGIERVQREAICHKIIKDELIRKADEPIGDVSMKDAIVHSSNVYFIWLANKYKLNEQLFKLYDITGMNLAGSGTNYFEDSVSEKLIQTKKHIWKNEFNVKGVCDDTTKRGEKCKDYYSQGISGAAWGQDPLKSTPLSISRMAGIIANNGFYQPSQFLIAQSGHEIPLKSKIRVAQQNGISQELLSYMKEHPFIKSPKYNFQLPNMAAKSGTAQRDYYDKGQKYTFFDGWLVFITSNSKSKSPMVVCIRIERNMKTEDVSSVNAAFLAKKIVEPLILNLTN